jgi:hypothetical protein
VNRLFCLRRRAAATRDSGPNGGLAPLTCPAAGRPRPGSVPRDAAYCQTTNTSFRLRIHHTSPTWPEAYGCDERPSRVP